MNDTPMDCKNDHDNDNDNERHVIVLELVPLTEQVLELEVHPVADEDAAAFDERWRQAELRLGRQVEARE